MVSTTFACILPRLLFPHLGERLLEKASIWRWEFMSKMILALAYKIFFELTKSLAPNMRQKKYLRIYPAGNYMFKVNNRDTRTRCEIFSKLTIKIPEQRQWQL